MALSDKINFKYPYCKRRIFMNYLRAFIAGLALPSILLPFLFLAAAEGGKAEIGTLPFFHFLPLIWGLWNVLDVALFRKWIPFPTRTRLLLIGACLGLLVVLIGIFYLHLPSLLGFPASVQYLPLIVGPILYALLWRFFVKPLNALLQVN
jgi:hypothetical protein